MDALTMFRPPPRTDLDQDRTEGQVARALERPADQGGLALAVRHACKCLGATASTLSAHPAMATWHNAVLAMAGRLKTRRATQPLLPTANAQMVALPSYGACSPRRRNGCLGCWRLRSTCRPFLIGMQWLGSRQLVVAAIWLRLLAPTDY